MVSIPSQGPAREKGVKIEKEMMTCPGCGRVMERRKEGKEIPFRGINICFNSERFVCPGCGFEAGSLEQTAAIQRNISDAYRQKMGLLTSGEIIGGRKKLKLSQEEWAEQMNIGIASLKRWEGSAIQSKSMDKILRAALAGDGVCGDPYTGNRTFSIARVRLVLTHFEDRLNRKILKKNDRLLFAAKYLWYADMLAFRDYGEGMTGATYAALPYGPQMNNYRDLIDDILKVDVEGAEPLSAGEERVIDKITANFPRDKMVFDAAHREKVWEEKPTGALIAYTDAARLTEV